MAPVDIEFHLLRKPFVPFRIVTFDGIAYDIRRPEMVMLGEASVIIGIPPAAGGRYFASTASVSLFKVVQIESIEPPTVEPSLGND
jgi:hypothetical protein